MNKVSNSKTCWDCEIDVIIFSLPDVRMIFHSKNWLISIPRFQLRSLFFTSSLVSGVDINVEHFDKVFVYANPRTNCARDVHQMIGRIRYIRTQHLIYFIKGQSGNKPTTVTEVMKYMNRSLRIANRFTKKILRKTFPLQAKVMENV